MADPIKVAEFTDDEKQQIAQETLGQPGTLEKLNDAQSIEAIVSLLKHPQSSFRKCFDGIEDMIDKKVGAQIDELAKKEREAAGLDTNGLWKRLKLRFSKAARVEKATTEESIKALLESEKKRVREEFKKKVHCVVYNAVQSVEPRIQDRLVAARSAKNIGLVTALDKLLHAADIQPRPVAPAPAAAVVQPVAANPTPAAVHAPTPAAGANSPAAPHAAPSAAQPAHAPQGHAAPAPAGHAPAAGHGVAPAHPDAGSHAATPGKAPAAAEIHAAPAAPEDIRLKPMGEWKTAGDIKAAQEKWGAVVNSYGEKPEEGDELHWQGTADEPVGRALNETEKPGYEEYKKFMAKAKVLEESLRQAIVKAAEGLKADETFTNEATKAAKKIIPDFAPSSEAGMEALFYYVMGVGAEVKSPAASRIQAYKKLTNIFLVSHISDARRESENKRVYDVQKGEDGKAMNVPLREYLKNHPDRAHGKGIDGENILENAMQTMQRLFEMYREKYPEIGESLDEFRPVLVNIIETKGGTAIGTGEKKLDAEKAREIYMSLLIVADNNVHEKEIMAMLMAMKDLPPYVFELNNSGNGWELGTKKRNNNGNVLEDFRRDQAMYAELKNTLKMNRDNFYKFIKKTAPIFERLRSYVLANPDKKAKELNAYFKETLPDAKVAYTDADLASFRNLMKIPLWMIKIWPAYKQAVYLEDNMDQMKVPKLKEIEGADAIKEIDMVFVNVEEKVQRIARRIADERLDREMKELGPQGWKEFYKVWKIGAKFWKRNAAEGYRQKYTEETAKRLKTDPQYRTELMGLNRDEVRPGNTWDKMKGSWIGKVPPAAGQEEAMHTDLDAIAERFHIAWNAPEDEEKDYLTDEKWTMEDVKASDEMNGAVMAICKDFENNAIDEQGFRLRVQTEVIPMIQALQQPPDEAIVAFLQRTGPQRTFEKGMTLTEDEVHRMGLLEKMRAHKAGLIALDLDNLKIKIALGKAKNVDVKTQVKDLGLIDRTTRSMVETLQRNRFLGRFINPSTIAVVGYGLGNIATTMLANKYVRVSALAGASALVAPGVAVVAGSIASGVVLGGAWGWFRQNKEQLHLKAQEERRRALGFTPSEDEKGMKNRYENRLREDENDVAKSKLYKQEKATDLARSIGSAIDSNNYERILQHVAHAAALNEISEMGMDPKASEKNRRRVDLISFSNERAIESERLALVKKIAEGKRKLRELARPEGRRKARDAAADFKNKFTSERLLIVKAAQTTEKNYKKFKRWENVKTVGMGALIGGTLSGAVSYFTSGYETIPGEHLTVGTVTMGELEKTLAARGVSATVMTDIKAHIAWETNGTLAKASHDYIYNTYGIDLAGAKMAGLGEAMVDPLGGVKGKTFTQTELIDQLKANGGLRGGAIDMSKIHFTNGHLDTASKEYLWTFHRVQIQEIPGAPGATNATAAVEGSGKFTFGSDWERLQSLHPNHNPGLKHVFDELRLGAPQLRDDGLYHMSVKGMLEAHLKHSDLPDGVVLPKTYPELQVGLQVNDADGVAHWNFVKIKIDENGDLALPKEVYERAPGAGHVLQAGKKMVGLKTKALAIGFKDKGTFQMLASVTGDNSYVPSPTPASQILYTGDIQYDKDGVTTEMFHAATKDQTTYNFFPAPVIMAALPQHHLEYGDKETAQAAPLEATGGKRRRRGVDGKEPAATDPAITDGTAAEIMAKEGLLEEIEQPDGEGAQIVPSTQATAPDGTGAQIEPKNDTKITVADAGATIKQDDAAKKAVAAEKGSMEATSAAIAAQEPGARVEITNAGEQVAIEQVKEVKANVPAVPLAVIDKVEKPAFELKNATDINTLLTSPAVSKFIQEKNLIDEYRVLAKGLTTAVLLPDDPPRVTTKADAQYAAYEKLLAFYNKVLPLYNKP